jgi:hypothetical protein
MMQNSALEFHPSPTCLTCLLHKGQLDDDFFSEEGLASLPALGPGKTDADGVARLSYQGSDIVMFAQASRSVGPQTERYTWLLHNPNPALTLSNDNLLSKADRKGLIAGK